MAVFEITDDKGQVFEIEGPDNASDADIMAVLQGEGIAPAQQPEAAPQGQPNFLEKMLGLPHAEQRNPMEALGAFNSEMQQTGVQMTEALGKRGVPAPLSAAAGMVPSFFPDLIAGMVGGPTGPRMAARGIEATASKAGKVVSSAKEFLGRPSVEEAKFMAEKAASEFIPKATAKAEELAAQTIKPLSEKITTIRTRLAQLPEDLRARRAELARLRKDAKTFIQTAEEEMGIHFKTTQDFEALIRNPKKMAEFAEKMENLAAKGAEEIARSVPKEQIQLFRKIAQESTGKVSNVANAQIQKGREVMAQALELTNDSFKAARKAYHQVENAIKETPTEFKAKADALKKALIEARAGLSETTKDMSRLVKEAKKADADELLKIKKEGIELVEKAFAKARVFGKVKKAAIGTALGAGGLKAFSLVD